MPDDLPRKSRQLVLVGGGHAHVAVLKAFGMQPLPEVRIILVSTNGEAPYSGMVPALISGHCSHDDIHVDLHRLARFAGADFCRDRLTGIDLKAKTVQLADAPPLYFDFLSLNTGSVPATAGVPGAAEFALATKPIDKLLAGLQRLEARMAAHGPNPFRIVTVGGGAGGVELTLALRHRLRGSPVDFTVVSATSELLATHAAGVRRRIARVLAAEGIHIRPATRVSSVTSGLVHCEDGDTIPFDALLWATHAAAPEWPAAAGLQVTGTGFVAVNRCLQSVSHEFVFAAGDVAEVVHAPRPKSGVFAVRQGPPLARNLRLALLGFRPKPYKPQRSFLSLISTGGRHAIASRGIWAADGGWVWHWKQRIDRRWLRQYRELPKIDIAQVEMDFTARMKANLRTMDRAATDDQRKQRCGGAGAKLGGLVLHDALRRLRQTPNPAILVGLASPDDAAVVTPPPGRALAQSIDFLRQLTNDPYLFGRITAAHALNDLHAKGATPMTALAAITLPPANERILTDLLAHVLAGAVRELNAANATLVGGHSAEGLEVAFGLAVSGAIPPTRVMRKSGLQPGDVLILTKPLGIGALFAADLELKLSASRFDAAVTGMLQSNATAAEIFLRAGVRACTDVGGFGLLGHLREMLGHGGVRLELWTAELPVYPGAMELLEAGFHSSMQTANLPNLALLGPGAGRLTAGTALLLDPQTAGGLLAGVPEDQAPAVVAGLRAAGYTSTAVIGRVCEAAAGPQVLLSRRAGPGGG